MASRVCPYCQGLNSEAEERCFRCGRRLPGPLARGAMAVVRDLLGVDAPMTRLVIGVELLVFALCAVVDRSLPIGLGDFVSLPWRDGEFRSSTLIRFGALVRQFTDVEPWRALSSGFVHANALHIGMNMLMFASLGSELERALGSARSVVLFVLSVICGALASAWWYGEGLMVGASGGVFGQIGALVGVLYAHRDPNWKKMLVRSLIYAVLISLAFTMVDGAAHFGGFAAGIVLGYALRKEQLRLKLHRTASVLAAVAIVACVASVVVSARSPLWQIVRFQERAEE